jgi:hypothetical protein
MTGAAMDATVLAEDRFDERLQLAKVLIDSYTGLGDDLRSKIREYLYSDMEMLAADELTLVQFPEAQLQDLQERRAKLKKAIVQEGSDGRISQVQSSSLLWLLGLEAA